MIQTTQTYLAPAIIDEMNVWVRIVAEHLKFHRGGLDPSIKQDSIFRALDTEARVIDYLYAQILSLNTYTTLTFNALVQKTYSEVSKARDMKIFMFQGIRDCKILSIIPAELADHVRRETDRFLGVIGRTIGMPTPTRETLGIPDGNRRALTIPRLLIPTLQTQVRLTDVLEEIMFFSRIHGEHAHHITMAVRPEVQEDIRVQAKKFEQRFLGNVVKAKAVEDSGRGFDELVRETRQMAEEFKVFIQMLIKGVTTCSVPTGQTNIWPLLGDHILRETIFFIGILDLAIKSL